MPETVNPAPCDKPDCVLAKPAKDVCPAPAEQCGATETPADCTAEGCPVKPAADCQEPQCPAVD